MGFAYAIHVAMFAVRSYRTFSPLPLDFSSWRLFSVALIPWVAPGGNYPPSFFRGARTFLCVAAAAKQPPDACIMLYYY